MNHLSNRISRSAAKYSRRAAKQAIAGAVCLLAFPLSDLPRIAAMLTDVPLAASYVILGGSITLLALALWSFYEVIRLDRLRQRYDRPSTLPIQF